MQKLGEYKGYTIYFNPENRKFVGRKRGQSDVKSTSYSALCNKLTNQPYYERGKTIKFSKSLENQKVTVNKFNSGGSYHEGELTGHYKRASAWSSVSFEVRMKNGKEDWVHSNYIFKGHAASKLKNQFEKVKEAQAQMQKLKEPISTNDLER